MGHKSIHAAFPLLYIVISCASIAQSQSPIPAPPGARQDNVRDVIHGAEIIDPYRWLEQQDSEETIAWVKAENSYSHSVVDRLTMYPAIARRLEQFLRHDSVSGAFEVGKYFFFFKKRSDQDQWSIYRRKLGTTTDELLIDVDKLSADHTTSVGFEDLTSDASLAVYSVRLGGQDETELHVMNLNTRRDLADVLPRAFYSGVAWTHDKSGFYYGVFNRETASHIYFHLLGTDHAKDTEVFGNGYPPGHWTYPLTSTDGRYLVIGTDTGFTKIELYVKDLRASKAKVMPIVSGIDAQFHIELDGDNLFVRTDWKSPNWRVLRIDLRHPEQEYWREVVPETRDAMEGAAVLGGKLFVTYLQNVATSIKIFSLEGKALGEVPLPPGTSANIYGRWDRDTAFLTLSSYTNPGTIYRYSVKTGERVVWYKSPVPFNGEQYETEQVWYSSKDGTRVPMFLVHKKGLIPNGRTPTILYGYGGFSASITPAFGVSSAVWLEEGGIWAVANIRGGGEFGEAWHRAGMLDKKQNVFDDFIAAAEWLIHNNYTDPTHLAIKGGSNGGLLVAAAMTQRPELFKAVACWHPDLDIVRYNQFTKNNLPQSLLEYGDAADPEQFRYVYAYSPYQHVKPGTPYPAVIFQSGDADSRVPPEQTRKMVARMQAATTSGLPILLFYDTKEGHAVSKPLTQQIEQDALEQSFLAWQLGMEAPKSAPTH